MTHKHTQSATSYKETTCMQMIQPEMFRFQNEDLNVLLASVQRPGGWNSMCYIAVCSLDLYL